MKTQEALNIAGRLHLTLVDKQGKTFQSFSQQNKIVSKARKTIAESLASGNALKPIQKIGVGTSSTAPSYSDTVLGGEEIRKPIEAVDPNSDYDSFTDDNGVERQRVRITANLDYTEGNAKLQEAGLYLSDDLNNDANDILYNRVVFPPINKTQDFTLKLSWELIF